MNDKSKRSRKRIFRGYPNNTLEQSILDAKDIIEQNLGMTIRKRALAKLWGISVNSSNYTSKINNMRGYGLTNAKKESEYIELTRLCKEILEPADQEQYFRVLREACKTPKKFAEFYKLLEDKKFPSIENLKRIVIQNISVDKDLVDEFIYISKENGLFSELISNDDEVYFGENHDTDRTESDFESYILANQEQSMNDNDATNIQKFKPSIISSKKNEQISLKYFKETKTLQLIKDILELLGIKYDEAYVSINDFFVSESSSEYSIFIIDTDINEDSTDIQFWMQLGAYLSQSSENYLFISSFDQSISVPDIYKDKILKLESSGNDQIFAQILKYLINTSVIDVNLT